MKRLFILVGCFVLLSLIGVWFFRTGALFGKRVRRVVLISIDTCRADYIGCYGSRLARTPNIDEMAKEGFLFKNVVSPVPLTLPAHSSMMTGTTPPYHGIHSNLGYRLPDSSVTLAEKLSEEGFVTSAVIAAFVLDSQFGLDQGFDYYNDRFDEELNTMGIAERRGGEVTRYGRKWLDEHKDESFFLFLHYYDPHSTYDPPGSFKPGLFSNRYSLYAGEISYTDHCIGRVIEKLKTLGIYDSTLIIIIGDHGEALGEHLEGAHGYFVYEETIKVPLIFKLPGKSKPRQIDDLVGLIDIMPTVCGLAGIENEPYIQGTDLSPYFKGKTLTNEQRNYYCESMTPTKYGCSSLLSVITSPFKYIQTTRPELYDLVKDPKEKNNIAEEQSQRARIMQDRLEQILEETVRKDPDTKLELDEEAKARLGALGYVGGDGITEDFEFDQSKADPKDLIEFHTSNNAVMYKIHKKELDKARAICKRLLKQNPEWATGYHHLAIIAGTEGNETDAAKYLTKALELAPDTPDLHFNMAKIFIKQENLDEALKHLDKALQLNPDMLDARNDMGMVLLKQKKFDEALTHFSMVLQLKPTHILAHNNLGDLFYKQGKIDKAINYWSKSISIEPDQPGLSYNLGMTLVKQGKVSEAVEYYLKSLEFDPNQSNVHNDLGIVLEEMNKLDEALVHYNKSLRLDPNQPKVHNTIGRVSFHLGNFDQAFYHYTESLKLKSDQEIIQNNIAEIYFQQGKNKQALMHWNKALSIKPDFINALNNLAWVKAAYEQEPFYNPSEAVRLAERAVELTQRKQPRLLDTLSVAYAAMGRFDEAIKAAKEAIELAQSAQQDEMVLEIKKHLQLYKAGRPYFDQSE